MKNIGCHTLRHSFATHLIEDGCSVSEVQALLGHKSPETTFVYVHTASPKLLKVKRIFCVIMMVLVWILVIRLWFKKPDLILKGKLGK